MGMYPAFRMLLKPKMTPPDGGHGVARRGSVPTCAVAPWARPPGIHGGLLAGPSPLAASFCGWWGRARRTLVGAYRSVSWTHGEPYPLRTPAGPHGARGRAPCVGGALHRRGGWRCAAPRRRRALLGRGLGHEDELRRGPPGPCRRCGFVGGGTPALLGRPPFEVYSGDVISVWGGLCVSRRSRRTARGPRRSHRTARAVPTDPQESSRSVLGPKTPPGARCT